MIWEQNVRIVVMLANLYEKGKSKCALYWPEEIGQAQSYQRVSVSVVEVIHKGNYIIRHMTIEEINSTYVSDQHLITQYHFIAWPDHGVPHTTTGLVRYMKEVQENQTQLQNELQTTVPTVVHCSAGAGRTGTFIGFDYLMKELNETGSIDVFKAVVGMREQRMEMVQTIEQYIFMHKLLAEIVAFSETDLQFEQLHEKVGQQKRYQHASEMSKEFNDLSILFGESTTSQVKIDNPAKVYYTSPEGSPGSQRNGIYKVESYNPADHLMIGDEPTSDGMEAFFRVLLLENTVFIVQVDQQMQATIWPNQHDTMAQYGGISLQFIDETINEDIKVTRIYVVNEEQQQKRQIFLFEFNFWTNLETPTDDYNMIHFLSMIESYHSVTNECSMLFLSRTGFSKSVLLCAAWNLMSRYRAESMVDVFRTVKDITDSLPDVPLSLDQYKACYSFIATYTNPSQE
uniref:protein-tyrosine-phosphatase n=1 Tax=Phallusia mammillata TaxID=59560 RepID=A0A6F9DPD2_9ASCI|nr:receptor-type tyrosine-protein phosphatase epsilon [Phallusia mammillata]